VSIDLASRGWQVVLGDETDQGFNTASTSRVGGKGKDVTQVVSALRYATRLPGGYSDASFNIAMPFRQAAQLVTQLRQLRIYHRGHLVWKGRIEEAPAAIEGVGMMPVTALGYSADLSHDEFTAIYGASLYDRWKGSWEVVQDQNPLSEGLTWFSPGFAPDSNANPGMVFGYLNGGPYSATADEVALVWLGVPGTLLRRVRCTLYGIGATNAAILYTFAMVPQGGFAWGSLPSGAQAISLGSLVAGDTALDVTANAVPLAADALRFDWDVSGSGAGTALNGFLVHSLRVTTELTAESPSDVAPNMIPLDPQNMDVVTVLRSALRWHGSTEVAYPLENFQLMDGSVADTGATTPVDQVAFPEPTTVEAVIEEVNKQVGYEWGVFDDGFRYGSLETITTEGQNGLVRLGSRKPQAWIVLRQADGHRIAMTRSLELVRNVVRVYYADASGVPFVTEASDLQNALNPLNVAGTRRVGTVTIPGNSDSATASAVAAAYLKEFSRPVFKGTVQLGTEHVIRRRVDVYHQADQSTFYFQPAAQVLPGQWVQLPDTIGAADQGGKGPFNFDVSQQADQAYTIREGGIPDSLVPIRGVEVNCDREVVTLTLDTSRDLFGIQLARLTRGGT
jgi:hypothetical protein